MRRKWTKEELKELKKVAGKKTVKEIMKMEIFKGRSFDSIEQKIKRLGKSAPKRRKVGNHYHSLWSPAEAKWLKLNWGKKSKQSLVDEFSAKFGFQRGYDSISKKADRLSLGPTFEGLQAKGELVQETPSEALLYLLTNTKRPLASDILCQSIEERTQEAISNGRLDKIVGRLREHGYDVKCIPSGGEIRYVMVRTGEISSEMYYRPLGELSSELAMSGDLHMGSKHFSHEAWDAFVDDIVEHSVADITLCGDLVQCLGVHRLEVADIDLWEIDDQVALLVNKLSMIPKDVDIHMVIGNHEGKLKDRVQVGYDALAHTVSKMNERGFHNCHYYGAVAKLIMDDEYDFLMMHSAGGITYATSYRPERVFDKLVERPNLFQVGHSHQLMWLPKPPHHDLFISGTMQRENAWLMNKGITSMVGWYGMRGYSPEMANLRRVTPRVH